MSAQAQTQVVITHSIGMHARPSVKFTKLAKTFQSATEIAIKEAGPWIDAKSIVKVMGMKAPQGSTLFIRANGDAAQEAVTALHGLVERNFDEGHADAAPA
ncbi:MAG: phosphocarrier protein HPr [Hyphomicrobiales bacterium]|nr:HPr family phosphocarrier protein [Hyphomicrobiales bacterium]PCJ94686.1 MAG: phosphocarrier protein HPr [Hyphomicrobiales bacterium]